MADDNRFEALPDAPPPRPEARKAALEAALGRLDKKTSEPSQGSGNVMRLRKQKGDNRPASWGNVMNRKHLLAAASIAALAVVGIPVTYVALDGERDGMVATHETEVAQAPSQDQKAASTAPSAADATRQELATRAPANVPQAAPQASSIARPATAPSHVASAPPPAAGEAAARFTTAPEALPQIPEHFGDDQFEGHEENAFKSVSEDPVATFSIDVDTASYSFVRSSLTQGVLPPKDAVRTEELINYFPYDYPAPDTPEVPFKATTTLYPSPWAEDRQLLHIGIKGFELPRAEQPNSNLVLLLDTSGSMQAPNKLPLLKQSFAVLLDTLQEDDTVAIVAYAGQAGTVLPPTPASEKSKILAALNRLGAGGSTAGGEGIRQAYALAEQSFDEDAVNRVMLATDGDFNVGITSTEELKGFVERKRESGIFLSVLGFGRGNYNDELMQALAQNGNGTAAYIDTFAEARKVLGEEATSTVFPIAKDVKIQIEFNPHQVAEYRLIGYESRVLRREDFNNDQVDAGDIGSGHTVTAIFEIVPAGAEPVNEPLRYGSEEENASPAPGQTDELAFLRIRYKLPDEDESQLIETPIKTSEAFAGFSSAPGDVRFATAVAAFGEELRGGRHLGDMSYDEILEIALDSRGEDPFGYRSEFTNLVRAAKSASALQPQR